MFKWFFNSQKEINYLRENNEKPIKEAIFNDTVKKAFIDFVKLNKNSNVCIIGGLSLGAWTRSRNTDDIDILVLTEDDIDSIEATISSKFKRNRKHSFEHKSYGVEIEVLTPEFLKEDSELIKQAIEHAKVDNVDGHDIRVVTPKYLIALKLGRAIMKGNPKSRVDQGDIMELVKIYGKFDLTGLCLSDEKLKLYNELCDELNVE